MPRVESWVAKKAANGLTNCTLENAAVRREWYAWVDWTWEMHDLLTSHQVRPLGSSAGRVHRGCAMPDEEAVTGTKGAVSRRVEQVRRFCRLSHD